MGRVLSPVRQAYRGRPSTQRALNSGSRWPQAGSRVSPAAAAPRGGRKPLSETDATLLPAVESLVQPTTRADPESPLRWTCKSTTKLAEELRPLGHHVSPRTVYTLLERLGYSLQSNRKTREGSVHFDRDAQFQHIAALVSRLQAAGQPVISVATKKKELIGPFYNKGREWQPKGQPEQVNVYDFVDADLGKAIPYGVYDLAANQGLGQCRDRP